MASLLSQLWVLQHSKKAAGSECQGACTEARQQELQTGLLLFADVSLQLSCTSGRRGDPGGLARSKSRNSSISEPVICGQGAGVRLLGVLRGRWLRARFQGWAPNRVQRVQE